MKKTNKKTGFTLIELLVTIMAASLLMLVVSLVLVLAFRSWRINNAYVDMRRDAALAVYLISRDIRESGIEDVSVSADQLILDSHPPVRNTDITYVKSGSSLLSSAFGSIINTGVESFSAQTNSMGDGVAFSLTLTNSSFNISLKSDVFVNTRN